MPAVADAARLEERAVARRLLADAPIGEGLVLEDEVGAVGRLPHAALEKVDEVAHEAALRACRILRKSTLDALPSSLTLFTSTREPGGMCSSASMAATASPPVTEPT